MLLQSRAQRVTASGSITHARTRSPRHYTVCITRLVHISHARQRMITVAYSIQKQARGGNQARMHFTLAMPLLLQLPENMIWCRCPLGDGRRSISAAGRLFRAPDVQKDRSPKARAEDTESEDRDHSGWIFYSFMTDKIRHFEPR